MSVSRGVWPIILGFLVGVVGCAGSTTPTESTQPITTTVPQPTVASTVASSTTTTDPWERARGMNLFDREGNYIGPVTEDGDPLILDPIEGYGDFSHLTPQERFDLDPPVIKELQSQCLIDQGFGSGFDDDGEFFFHRFQGEQLQLAVATALACKEGLHFPPREPRTRAMWEELYAYQLAWIECAATQGIIYEDFLSLEELIASEGSYSLENDPLANISNEAARRLFEVCPQNPVGGFGNWDPGDPIAPAVEG